MFSFSRFLLIACALSASVTLNSAQAAVSCTPETINLETQVEVDNFQTDHGPCDHVVGDLHLLSSQAANLDGLSALETIDGDLLITANSKLEDVDGFSALKNIGGRLRISFNEKLLNVDGLAGLTKIEHDLEILDNNSLANLDGFSGIVSIGWNIIVSFNDVLTDVDGLSSLVEVDQIVSFTQNPQLTNVDGLAALVHVGQFFVTNNLALVDCSGIAQIVDSFDDAEPGPGPGVDGVPDVESSVKVEKNASGCKSVEQVLTNAPLAMINAGINDAWYNKETDGQGMLIIVFPVIKQVFLAWFTFDTERPPEDVEAILGDPGQRWLTAQGDYEGNEAELDVYITAGGVFDSEQPTTSSEWDGIIHLKFSTCNAGTVSYYINSIDLEGTVPIERIVWDNGPLCYELGKQMGKS
jgi:hypothetical protein